MLKLLKSYRFSAALRISWLSSTSTDCWASRDGRRQASFPKCKSPNIHPRHSMLPPYNWLTLCSHSSSKQHGPGRVPSSRQLPPASPILDWAGSPQLLRFYGIRARRQTLTSRCIMISQSSDNQMPPQTPFFGAARALSVAVFLCSH